MKRRVLFVFLPGVKGTELWCDQCGRRAWPPAFIDNPIELAVRSASKRFSLHPEILMNDNEFECIRNHNKTPVAVIGAVKALRGFYTRNVYNSFLKRLRLVINDVQNNLGGTSTVVTQLVTFPYDWTRSNVESANRLYRTLLKTLNVYDDIILVAHSMGGLVCRYLLENILRGDERHKVRGEDLQSQKVLAEKIVLFYGIGVPHYGCIKSLHQLVNPKDKIFGRVCRSLSSLYEMIPFSDLTKRQPKRRRRSNIFLHNDGRQILIDPFFWRLNNKYKHKDKSIKGTSVQDSPTINALVTEYPVLQDSKDKLYNGLAFHRSLNTDLKPYGCVYVLVNATGVPSPSKINSRGQLENECIQGDGVVCSVMPEKINNNTGPLRLLLFRRRLLKDRQIKRKTLSSRQTDNKTFPRDHAYTNSVHISMLNNINLTVPIRGVLTERFHHDQRKNWVVEYFMSNKLGDSNIRSCLFKTYINLVESLSSKQQQNVKTNNSSSHAVTVSSPSGVYSATVVNNVNSDCCIVKLNKNTVEKNLGGNILLTVVKEAAGRLEEIAKPKPLSIKVSTHKYGTTWNGLEIVLTGQCKRVLVQEENNSTLTERGNGN